MATGDRSHVSMPLAIAYALFFGFVVALVPAFVSIYNPHRYEQDPLFTPDALRNTLVAVLVAVPVVWLFGRRWPTRLIVRFIVAGIVLCAIAGVLLALSASRPMREAGPVKFVAALSATIAIPCVGLVSALISNKLLGGRDEA
ncbi:MAG: hypothetical protein WD716_01875 [Fimbriimonadaceae bacterium]